MDSRTDEVGAVPCMICYLNYLLGARLACRFQLPASHIICNAAQVRSFFDQLILSEGQMDTLKSINREAFAKIHDFVSQRGPLIKAWRGVRLFGQPGLLDCVSRNQRWDKA